MPARTRGLTVTIDGDTTGLTKALANVNKEVKNTQSQLKDVDKLLKLDPTNTELLSQKQRLLGDAIRETRTKLDTLKTASDQANISLQNGEISQEQFDALQREIIETTEAVFHNTPLQNFYRAVMGHINYNTEGMVHSCWFGTGTSEPTGSETGLEHGLWTYGWNNSNIISWQKYLNEENHICHKYTFKISADQSHVGTVSEVGVAFCTANPGLGLVTRALILDAEGNPMTITKTDLEVLYVDVIFEITLQDTEHFKWCPENYINYGSKSGTGWGAIFSLRLFDRIFFLGKMKGGGFNIRHLVCK